MFHTPHCMCMCKNGFCVVERERGRERDRGRKREGGSKTGGGIGEEGRKRGGSYMYTLYLYVLCNLQHHDFPHSLSGQTANLFRQIFYLVLRHSLRLLQLQVRGTEGGRRERQQYNTNKNSPHSTQAYMTCVHSQQ